MSIFNFGEINFKTDGSRSPLNSLYNSAFETTTLRYPIDLGTNVDKRHYIIFYVRRQKNTSVTGLQDYGGNLDSGISNPISGALSNLSGIGGSLMSGLNSNLSQLNSMSNGALNGITSAIGGFVNSAVNGLNDIFSDATKILNGYTNTQDVISNSIKQITGGSIKFMRTILTTDAISLYMPDTLLYQYSQSYDLAPIGTELGGQMIAATRSAMDDYKQENVGGGASLHNAGWSATKSALLYGINEAGSALGNTGRAVAGGILGVVKNPMLEMIYSSPDFREFQFDFMFYPRDEKEAYEVQRIIERFRFHQAPELEKGAQGFLVPPSEFDIRLCCNGQLNPNLPNIATCVLTNMIVNYAPNGFSAYEVAGDDKPKLGGTGMPVAIQMTLTFKETTYLTKADFSKDIAVGGSTLKGAR